MITQSKTLTIVFIHIKILNHVNTIVNLVPGILTDPRHAGYLSHNLTDLKRTIRPKNIYSLRTIVLIMPIIGTAKVTYGGKIALISDVKKKLNANIGDIIVFEETANGDILIKKG